MKGQNLKHPCLNREQLFNSLNLNFPGLEKVKDAVKNKDWNLAKRAFADYLRKRDKPVWFFDGRARTKTNGDSKTANTKTADNALNLIFTAAGIEHKFRDKIDWKYNPTTQPNSPNPQNNEWTWQFNRHDFWLAMGRAYWETGDEKYVNEFVRQMADWTENNPVPLKADRSPFSRWRTLEAGIRMAQTWPYAFYYCLSSPNFTDEAIITMVQSMVEHARYLKTFATRVNWLTMEMNGLYHVGALFPEFKEAEEWRHFAATRMRQELESQVYPDGAQVELTPGYHNVALDSFMGIFRIAGLNKYNLPAGYLENLERMYAFNMWIMTPDRDVPPFNDSWHVDVSSSLHEGFLCFKNRNDFLWIASDEKEGIMPGKLSYDFPYAGYILLRSGWERSARYLAFDAGPFGACHQHEDKLSFMLMAYGKRFVVDAGIYTYDYSKWRKYIISPYGHNVVFVDGLGQNRRSKQETYTTKTPCPYVFETAKDYDYAEGSYGNEFEGFGPDCICPVVQTRRILFVKNGEEKDFWVVLDTLIPKDEKIHSYESVFHLDVPGAVIDKEINSVITRNPNGQNMGIFPLNVNGLGVKIVKGQEEPFVQGWLPKAHGRTGVNPIPVPAFTLEKSGLQYLFYVFYPVSGETVPKIEVKRWELANVSSDDGIAAEIKIEKDSTYKVFFPNDKKRKFKIQDGVFKGKVYLKK